VFLDFGFSARTVAVGTGLVMLIPAALFAFATRKWTPEPPSVGLE
jgi:hypothetical protein